MPTKRLLDARRSRKALPRGFGWVDHRLLRDGYLKEEMARDVLALLDALEVERVKLVGHDSQAV